MNVVITINIRTELTHANLLIHLLNTGLLSLTILNIDYTHSNIITSDVLTIHFATYG